MFFDKYSLFENAVLTLFIEYKQRICGFIRLFDLYAYLRKRLKIPTFHVESHGDIASAPPINLKSLEAQSTSNLRYYSSSPLYAILKYYGGNGIPKRIIKFIGIPFDICQQQQQKSLIKYE